MEEIKLPKFKTKEELEQFAMGLMTENESLKKVIVCKDKSISTLNDQLYSLSNIEVEYERRQNEIQDLEAEIKSLKENPSEDKYRKLYCNEAREHMATRRKCYDTEHELSKAKEMVHKLCSMVTFMFGLLPRFKAERVTDAFGEFHIEDYRL